MGVNLCVSYGTSLKLLPGPNVPSKSIPLLLQRGTVAVTLSQNCTHAHNVHSRIVRMQHWDTTRSINMLEIYGELSGHLYGKVKYHLKVQL